MVLFLKNVFSISIVSFLAKKQKISEFRKLKIYMKKKENILKRKRFHSFKRNLYQNGKVENMPGVAGRLVFFCNQFFGTIFLQLFKFAWKSFSNLIFLFFFEIQFEVKFGNVRGKKKKFPKIIL